MGKEGEIFLPADNVIVYVKVLRNVLKSYVSYYVYLTRSQDTRPILKTKQKTLQRLESEHLINNDAKLRDKRN